VFVVNQEQPVHETYTPSLFDRMVVGAALLVFSIGQWCKDLAATYRVWRGGPRRCVSGARSGPAVSPLRLVSREQSRLDGGPATRARRAGVDELVIDDQALWAEYTGQGILREQDLRRG
jgi:hypothetical protein